MSNYFTAETSQVNTSEASAKAIDTFDTDGEYSDQYESIMKQEETAKNRK